MFKNVDIAEVFNIRNFTHGGWYDKSNTKRKDLIQWIRARYTPQKWRRGKYADGGFRAQAAC
ncbi:hypothetical protein [Ruminococcus bicirculans (ex Wegman et al. 2014)]|jgi:hypothetical protein|uniref:hypothetical protein n=1 Tax=Ruminococcus TaxID=1263 RepID=UPI00241E1E66|nr:hypothetical protein [Ruminococcus bicirculans (ex Wegman et al. 2014)]